MKKAGKNVTSKNEENKTTAPPIPTQIPDANANGEVKRGRGRPKKDPNAAPTDKINFRVKHILEGQGHKCEIIFNSHDGQTAISIANLAGNNYLILERGEGFMFYQAALEHKIKRSMKGVFKALELLDIETEDDEDDIFVK